MEKFKAFVPVDIIEKGEKGKDGLPEKLLIAGVASSMKSGKKDKDGHRLNVDGFDYQPFLKSGFFNLEHKGREDYTNIVGEPTNAYVKDGEFHVEGQLYKDNPKAVGIYQLGQILKKSGSTRKIGYSIEGQVAEKNPLDPSDIRRAVITGVALTISPKCDGTEALFKGGEVIDYEPQEGSDLLIDITDSNGVRWTVDKNLQLEKSEKIEGLEKGGPGSGKYVHLQNGHKFASKGHGMKYGAAQQQIMREAQDHYKKHAESLSDHELVEDHTNASAGSMHQGTIARELHKRANQHLQDEYNKNRTEGHPPTIHDIEHAKKVLLSKKQIEKSFDDEIEKGGVGSGRHKSGLSNEQANAYKEKFGLTDDELVWREQHNEKLKNAKGDDHKKLMKEYDDSDVAKKIRGKMVKKATEASSIIEIEKGGAGSGRHKYAIGSKVKVKLARPMNAEKFDEHEVTVNHHDTSESGEPMYGGKNEKGKQRYFTEKDVVQKAMEAGSITGTETHNQSLTQEPLKQESIAGTEGKKKKKKGKIFNNTELTKGEIYEYLIDEINLDIDSVKRVYQLAEMIEKAGEGSRGGKVIGHTKSGKPIYADKNATHSDYKNFTHEDHMDAFRKLTNDGDRANHDKLLGSDHYRQGVDKKKGGKGHDSRETYTTQSGKKESLYNS